MKRTNFATLPWADPNDPAKSTYPAGSRPWNGTATRQTPSFFFFTPDVTSAPTAQNMNAALGVRDDALIDVMNATCSGDAINFSDLKTWASATTGTGDTSFAGPAWNEHLGIWIVSYKVGTSYKWASSADGSVWFAVGSSSQSFGNMDEMAFDPSSGVGAGIGQGQTYWFDPSAFTWTNGVAIPPVGAPALTTGVGSTTCAWFKGNFIAVYNCRTSTAPSIIWSPAVGTGFTLATGTTYTAGSGGTGAGLMAQSSARLLLVSESNSANYGYSSDGKAWTQGTLPALLTNEVPKGLAFDDSTNTFYLLLSTSSAARVFSSTDGITWTLAGSVGWSMNALAANGSTLVSSVSYTWGTRVVLSTDGGATWKFTRLGKAFGSRLDGGSQSISSGLRLKGNDRQFLASDAANQTFASSHALGVPSSVP